MRKKGGLEKNHKAQGSEAKPKRAAKTNIRISAETESSHYLAPTDDPMRTKHPMKVLQYMDNHVIDRKADFTHVLLSCIMGINRVGSPAADPPKTCLTTLLCDRFACEEPSSDQKLPKTGFNMASGSIQELTHNRGAKT